MRELPYVRSSCNGRENDIYAAASRDEVTKLLSQTKRHSIQLLSLFELEFDNKGTAKVLYTKQFDALNSEQ